MEIGGIIYCLSDKAPLFIMKSTQVDRETVQAPAASPAYRTALAERSSYVENVLTHRLIAALAGELWRRDPTTPLDIFKAEVDDAGFDLVLGCGGLLRYIQIKQMHSEGSRQKFSVRLDFTKQAGSCVLLIVHDEATLELKHFMFFGNGPNMPMPDVDGAKASVAPGRRDKSGGRKVRLHYRDIPRTKFQGPLSTSQLLDALFPGWPSEHD